MIKRAQAEVSSWTTFGQTALLIIAALLVAQLVSFLLVRNIVFEWQRAYVDDPAIARFAEVAAELSAAPLEKRAAIVSSFSRAGEAFRLSSAPPILPITGRTELETVLAEALHKHGLKPGALIAHRGFDPGPMDHGPPPEHPHGIFAGPRDVIRLAAQLPDGQWLVARFQVMRAFPLLLNPLFLSQAALFVVLLTATLFSAARISRPLRRLARAAESLRPQEAFEPLAVEGPREVKVAITSFNSMALRVRELLAEKDRMLTAIGHDLRTPLASLRIRAENIDDDSEREKIIETVDEMTSMVEEILAFARLGYSTEARQLVDLSALADAVAEEFASLGKEVVFVDSPRAPVMMQSGLMRRLIRNLIDNAVKYAGKAEVSVRCDAGTIALLVQDEGPGIPPERLGDVLQPFSRVETSRSRLTGGAGLGLSIADAIARGQGASLVLQNRSTGGLRASVIWPASALAAR